jgi:methionyl-tRNA formyltransferase
MNKSLGRIDWSNDAVAIERLVRGLNSWPSAYTSFNGKTLKLWSCNVVENVSGGGEPGTIINVTKDYFDVLCGVGALRILELQLEGKKRMDTKSFLLGNQWKPGMKLG